MPTISDVRKIRQRRFRRKSCGSNSRNFATATKPQPNNTTANKTLNTGRGSFSYTEILFKPDLLNQVFDKQDVKSSNPLLEMCLDSGSKLLKAKSVPKSDEECLLLPPILRCCSSSESFNQAKLDLLLLICQNPGCDINTQSAKGLTAMHYLIKGCAKDTFIFTLKGIYFLLNLGINCQLQDCQGNTPLTSIHSLLDRGLYSEATVLAHLLQLSKCNINHINKDNMTLLSYSIRQGDKSSALTRLLLNLGASVWPYSFLQNNMVEQVMIEREQSSFTWFLRALMDHKITIEESEETIYLLGTAMGEDPNRMREHVARIMLQLGHSMLVNGPLFRQLRSKLIQFWTKPQALKYLCLTKIRHCLGPKNLSELRTLDLPFTMLQYLQLF